MYEFFFTELITKLGCSDKKPLGYIQATLIRNNYETHLEQMGQVQTRKTLALPSEKTLQSGRKRIPRKNRKVPTLHS
jgi:hypothetical protein